MGRISQPYTVRKRPDTGHWQVSLNPTSGLSPQVCAEWKRKSFDSLPDALAEFRYPRHETAARRAALALINHLAKGPARPRGLRGYTVDTWIRKFLDVKTSPRAAELNAANRPYSPGTIDEYKSVYNRHLKGDPFMDELMNEVDLESTIGLLNRIASHEITPRVPTSERPRPARVKAMATRPQKPVRLVAGTRTYEIVYSFVRMTFRSYQKQHPGWFDPFLAMERPKKTKSRRRGLESAEVARLFAPGVLLDEMERAVCAAMFWAGLRRSEIFGLLPEDLDWTTPKLNVDHAWKNFGKKNRTLGDPKHHKHREAPFPDVLQKAIRELWEKNGKHEYVFSFADGTIPGETWFREHVQAWFDRAGIELSGRKITPHSARHSLASILEAQGTPIRYIQDLLGHSDYETTAGYLHTPQDMINKITDSLDKAQADSAGMVPL